ncbi:CLIP-associating protein 2 isoform X13 [Anolis carolinensis]|uniref:CLIP-associating protein 2 isoform X13 n=1 Tax=Anolis carolinensis TaxID=28377 RepID=UPI002F2B6369
MEHGKMDYFCDQVQQKDVSRRIEIGKEFLKYLSEPSVSTDLEQDQQRLDKVIDELTGWVNSSNYKVSLLGIELLGAFVDRLLGRFKSYLATVVIVLVDRMGDAKDQVREQAQNLALKLMDKAAQPMFVWEHLSAGFKHRNYRSREGVCLCLLATLNYCGAQSLILSKLVPHLCILFGDSNSQVRDAAILAIVEIYKHVGEKVRADLNKRGLPSARLQTIFMKFDEVRNCGDMISSNFSDKSFDDEESVDGNRPSSAASAFKVPAPKKPGNPSNASRKPGSAGGPKVGGPTKEGGAGAVDEDDFIKAFTDVPTVQIYSARELEETLNKIREILSDDKHDWDQRANALKKVRSLLVAGAAQYDCFFQHLRLLDGAFKLSAKDLRSQVVREACITVAHLSTVLGNKFDHGAEAIVPTLFNLVPNTAKVMATSGCAAIRFIIRHTHVPRLIPLITSNCTSKSVAVRRRSFEFLNLLLQEWQTHSLERHAAVLVETIKKGVHDADAEARVEARKTYLGLRNHFPGEAEVLYNSLEPSYQRSLQTYLKNSGSIASLPQSDRSSSSSQESLNRPFSSKWSTSSSSMAGRVPGSTKTAPSPGTLQRSRSDIDVNAAAGAKARHAIGQPGGAGRFAAAGLPPGSYASLGRVRTKLSTPSIGLGNSKTDSRGRSRTKVVSQSQPGSRSGSPGRVLTTTTLSTLNTGVQRVLVSPATAQKRSKIPRSQGCSREASPSRLSVARGSRIPRPSVSQGCSREASRESSRDTSPVRSFAPLASRHHSRSTGALYSPDVYGATGTGFGISQSSRLSSSVSAMRVLNTGSDVEEAVADALLLGDMRTKKKPVRRRYESYGMYSDDDANSDASSACSERSYSSRNGTIPTYMRQTEDVAEVLNRCASSNWSERKEGLLGLQNLLKNQRTLSRVELKRLCEIFTRMFADPHSKVFSMFLETLVDFIQVHKEDLQDWLFVLLTQLLKKMGADLLGSVQAKVQKALDVTRESFPNDLQFSILMRFTVDQTQTPSLKTVKPALQDQLRSFWSSKVKVGILKYIETLAQQMDPGDFVNSSETRLAVSRIITWTTEPKSSDVRKAAQSVLISLFELNTPEFTMLLGALPKTFQDGATKLLHSHLRNTGNGGQSSMGSPLTRPVPRSPASWSSPITSPTNTSQNTLSPSAFDYDTENMNSEEIYSSLRGVTEAIQNFSFRSQEDMNEPIKRDSKKEDVDSICSGSGIVDLRVGGGSADTGRTALDNKTSLLNTMPPHSSPRSREYNPYNYSDSVGSFNKSALKEAMFDDDAEQFPEEPPLDHSDLVAELLKELSNHNERVEERKAALYELMKLTQEESFGVWDEHFKTILLLLLETLGDKEHAIRALALKVLREILRHQPARFRNYAELTIMKTLEAHKDPHKEVVRSAEEAATMLATSISPDQCIKVLCPIIQTADYPINLAAIKMQTKVIERVSKETLAQLLPEIVPGLIQGYDNSESSVRKACVFCLVAIHAVIGDELKPHLSQLTGSKMKLLNLYIKRAQTGSGAGDASADVPGQS